MYSNRQPVAVGQANHHQQQQHLQQQQQLAAMTGQSGANQQPQELFRKLTHEYTCPLCHVKFGEKAGLEVHHPCYFQKRPGLDPRQSVGGPYTCHFAGCGKVFDLMYALRRHMIFHFDEFYFECNVCSKQTKSRSDIVKHVRTHKDKDVKPFKCRFCPKAFTDRSALNNHLKTHTTEKPFKCSWSHQCDAWFKTVRDRNAHEKRVHQRQGPTRPIGTINGRGRKGAGGGGHY